MRRRLREIKLERDALLVARPGIGPGLQQQQRRVRRVNLRRQMQRGIPSRSLKVVSAPAANNSRSCSSRPASTAAASGVAPVTALRTFTCAPLASSNRRYCASCSIAAVCSALLPSSPAAAESAPRSSNACTLSGCCESTAHCNSVTCRSPRSRKHPAWPAHGYPAYRHAPPPEPAPDCCGRQTAKYPAPSVAP